VRVVPDAVEFWSEADDRIHERRLFARDGWAVTLLSP
jgi:pyridoxine/pyridoxamine 5'-phosphate oxidase